MDSNHHRIVIIGGGTAGIVVAAMLRRAGEKDILIIKPSAHHFYQPIWTLVGAGCVRKEFSVREESRYIPAGAQWLRDSVCEVAPDKRMVATGGGVKVGYDFLVVAAGIQYDWDAIPGLREALATDSVSTNYQYNLTPKTWQLISGFRCGTALFHMPSNPIKCPGAPQKIMYLAADHFRKKGIAAKVIYGSGTPGIYGIKEYAAVLNRVVERYGIDARYGHELVEIDPGRKEALFECRNDSGARRVVIPYDIMHVVPPQVAPEFIRNSPLADRQQPQGWVKLDKSTMQHPDFPEVFALGDVGNTPNSKTAASACKQAPVLVANLLSTIAGKEPVRRYDGYVACPIVTGYGKMLLCEFDYSGKPTPTLPFINTFKERYDMWLLKRHGLPWLYWNVMLRGRGVPFVYTERAPIATEQAAALRA
ncbi:MAG: FAD/NAD(P)-binding oxidoreductase [Candidatus Binataceae bacterium]